MSDILSQDDLNALMGGLELEGWGSAPSKSGDSGADTEKDVPEGVLSQDVLNALMDLEGWDCAPSEPSQDSRDVLAEQALSTVGGESLGQDEIDELLAAFGK